MRQATSELRSSCCQGQCGTSLGRREFLEALGLAAAVSFWDPSRAVAGPFESSDFEKLVPADKKLKPEWIKSLFERGEPEVYRGDELHWLACRSVESALVSCTWEGTVRCGTGTFSTVTSDTGAEHYASPHAALRPAGARICHPAVRTGGVTNSVCSIGAAFDEIAFRGEYPIATGRFPRLRVSGDGRSLVAYSPFIPAERRRLQPCRSLSWNTR